MRPAQGGRPAGEGGCPARRSSGPGEAGVGEPQGGHPGRGRGGHRALQEVEAIARPVGDPPGAAGGRGQEASRHRIYRPFPVYSIFSLFLNVPNTPSKFTVPYSVSLIL